jgi:hypothetical protein
MKTLATLIKLQKTRVDEQRQVLAKLQEQLALIEGRIMQLEIEKAREQAIAQEDEVARAALGAYLKGAIDRGRKLEKERHVMGLAIEAARDVLMQLFEEQKRYEIADAARIEAEERESQRRERLDLDEIGTTQFQRHKE